MTLPGPDPRLRVSVVIPAKDEQERITACLDALARQVNVPEGCYEVLLVLDGCTDSTGDVVEEWKRSNDMRLHVLDGPARGVGLARKLGMDTAFSRLAGRDGAAALISSTDADSVVADDWLATQILLAEGGAEAIGGRIELEESGADLPEHVLDWYEAQGRLRHSKVMSRYAANGGAKQDHWQFSGASMAVTPEAYVRIGGLRSVGCLEDERLEQELEAVGISIHRSSDVKVTTSARLEGRAEQGLANDLALAASDESLESSGDPCSRTWLRDDHSQRENPTQFDADLGG